jgi:hypothetical protein
MADKKHDIVAPVPVYMADQSLLSLLAKELQEEKEKNLVLTRNLAMEKHKTQQLESYFLTLSNIAQAKPEQDLGRKVKKNESCETLASLEDLTKARPQIGTYSSDVRLAKIRKYKEKVKKYRQRVRISRDFNGRSVVAKIKPRVNGKFVKSVPQDLNNCEF